MISALQWSGLATNASPYAIPPGASVEQINLQCLSPGQLTVRRGLTMTNVPGNSPIVRSFLYHHDGKADIICQSANGQLTFLGELALDEPSTPRNVSLATSPSAPSGVKAGSPPDAPSSVLLATIPSEPDSVLLAVSPDSPAGLSLATSPSAPTGVALFGATNTPTNVVLTTSPRVPAGLTLTAAPQPPSGVLLAAAPYRPTSISLAVSPSAPSGLSLTTSPVSPTGLALATIPDAPTGVAATGPIPDSYYGLVVLLLQDQATDESPAGQTLIYNGSSTITSSLSKVGSNSFFTSSGSYPTNMVEVANSGGLLADRDWTVEMWVRRTTARDTTYLWSTGTADGALHFLINTSDEIRMARPNNVYLNSGALTWNADQWYHIAGVRTGNTVMAFRDGVLVATGSFSGTYAAINNLNYVFGAQTATHDAYFDLVRVTDGYARYTSAGYTPPTVPFTIGSPIAPTGVSLTAFPQAPSLISATPAAGDPYYSSVAALSQDTEYDESPNGLTFVYTNASMTNTVSKVGSQCLDLTAASAQREWTRSTTWFEDRDFTIECWAMFPNYSPTSTYRFFRSASIGPNFVINAGKLRCSRAGNAFANVSVSLASNTWYHFAVTRRDNGSGASDYYEIFLDGVSVVTATHVENWTNLSANNQDGEMYMDQFRVTDGVARYTSNFTPETRAFPTQYTVGSPMAPSSISLTTSPETPGLISATASAADSHYSSVVALSQDTQYDESPNGLTFVYTNASMTNTVSKVGEQCLDLTAASAERQWSRSTAWFEDRDFTIECFVMFPNYSSTATYRFFLPNNNGPKFVINAGNLRASTPGSDFLSVAVSLSSNTWYHFAVTRRDNGSGSSDYYEIFLDGVSVGTATRAQSWTNTAFVLQDGEMYMDQFRVTDGVARYTSNFTPETRAFSTQ